MRSKKGQQIANINPILMAIIGAAFVLAIGLIVMQEFKTSAVDTANSITYTEKDVAITADTFVTLDPCVPELDMTVSAVSNGSGESEMLLTSGNYTVVKNTINISNSTLGLSVNGLGSTVNITYSCKSANHAYNATNTTISKLVTVPTWIGIIIVISMAMLVLGYFYTRT